jgi:hypothetical protein
MFFSHINQSIILSAIYFKLKRTSVKAGQQTEPFESASGFVHAGAAIEWMWIGCSGGAPAGRYNMSVAFFFFIRIFLQIFFI